MHNAQLNPNDGDRVQIAKSATAKLLKQSKAALALGISEGTLRSWRDCPRLYIGSTGQRGHGRRVRYDLDEVLSWLKATRRIQPAQQAEAATATATGKEVER